MANWKSLAKQIETQLTEDVADGILTQIEGHQGSANTAIVAFLKRQLEVHGPDELRRQMQASVEHYQKQGSYTTCLNVLFRALDRYQ